MSETSNVLYIKFENHKVPEFKEVKTKIEEFLKGQKVNEAIQKYLVDTKKTAKIEILLK